MLRLSWREVWAAWESVLKSRAELDRTPRTVFFEITGWCQGEKVDPVLREQAERQFPIRITVHWPPGEPNYATSSKCDGAHYLLTDAALIATGRSGRVWVCEHMGRLVE